MKELYGIVEGDVQGVGFRAKAKHIADTLGLKGFAKNCNDGTVEICAQGESCEGLIQQLRHFHCTWAFRETDHIYEDFKIL